MGWNGLLRAVCACVCGRVDWRGKLEAQPAATYQNPFVISPPLLPKARCRVWVGLRAATLCATFWVLQCKFSCRCCCHFLFPPVHSVGSPRLVFHPIGRRCFSSAQWQSEACEEVRPRPKSMAPGQQITDRSLRIVVLLVVVVDVAVVVVRVWCPRRRLPLVSSVRPSLSSGLPGVDD